ncbi:hypothetical protein HHK36_019299 [Tetracentron sinense]|uniref:Uncharacterized protein n=1 Tax=Tetracentron sinense TaxID=13715 RepID=A0A835D9H2_TETSI|nr:hypothetical protein HHK36_019299 [Tetracentron sinense]
MHTSTTTDPFASRVGNLMDLFGRIACVTWKECNCCGCGRLTNEKGSMEDSTAMTIEFLRARLLSERSVSRTARQRADGLAKRVLELEEQLKIVTLQRKKAEKAAAEVLAILENHGISDHSEAFDSSSEQEGVLRESKEGNNSTKEDGSSVTSISRRNDAEEFSGLELECSPLPGRSLSWKSCQDSPYSLEKKYIDQARRRCSSSFASTIESSPKRLAVDEAGEKSVMLNGQENGVVTGLEDVPNYFNNKPEISREGSKNEEELGLLEGIVSDSFENRKVANDGLYVEGSRRDTEMERALEQQAQLIDQNEAEENAQREWEEKFRENSSCTPDSYEPGTRSDITEERDETRAEAAEPAMAIASCEQGAKSEAVDACLTEEALVKTLPNGFLPTTHVDVGWLRDQQCSSTLDNESSGGFPGFTFPGHDTLEAKAKERQRQKQKQEQEQKQKQEWLEISSLHPHSRGSPSLLSAKSPFSSHVGGSSYKGESSGSQNEFHALELQGTSNGLVGVLEALQRAKLSLKHELNGLPLAREGGTLGRAIEPPVPAIRTGDAMEVSASRANFFGSVSGSSLTRHHTDMGIVVAPGDRYTTSPYLETGSINSTRKPYFDPYMDTRLGLPASSRYTFPSYTYPLLRMPSNDGHPRPNMGPGMPAGDQYSFYEDLIKPNMRRYYPSGSGYTPDDDFEPLLKLFRKLPLKMQELLKEMYTEVREKLVQKPHNESEEDFINRIYKELLKKLPFEHRAFFFKVRVSSQKLHRRRSKQHRGTQRGFHYDRDRAFSPKQTHHDSNEVSESLELERFKIRTLDLVVKPNGDGAAEVKQNHSNRGSFSNGTNFSIGWLGRVRGSALRPLFGRLPSVLLSIIYGLKGIRRAFRNQYLDPNNLLMKIVDAVATKLNGAKLHICDNVHARKVVEDWGLVVQRKASLIRRVSWVSLDSGCVRLNADGSFRVDQGGMKFKPGKEDSFLNIKFRHGLFETLTITINGFTSSFFSPSSTLLPILRCSAVRSSQIN